ncbi:hypothetical protein [Pseudomonas grimontii]|uniref:hypothetical protein n=1 Tax=Pseudomonas grimontii TaxID=129847 RepID=UPI001644F9ED|nr:hypothetical protein [Pseudomonas grimontii]
MLVNGVCHPRQETLLDDEQNLWCQRLIKALSPHPISVDTDAPLHYLRAWVEPAVWQRLRLGFSRCQVLELDQHPRLLDSSGRMNTLWQAAIWRAISTTNNEQRTTTLSVSLYEKTDHVLCPQDRVERKRPQLTRYSHSQRDAR